MARALVVALSMAVIVGLSGTVSAREQRAKTSWRSETEGSPIATIDGQWSVSDEGIDRVQFRGPHVAGNRTTFQARWTSPWVTVSNARSVELAAEGGLEFLQAPGTAVDVVEMTRIREKGGKWSPWMRFRLPSQGTWGGVWWSSGTLSLWVGNPRPQRLRFEWRLVGEAKAVSHLEGWAEVSLAR